MAFAQRARTLPGVSFPSRVVRSIIRIARSSAQSFDSLLDRALLQRVDALLDADLVDGGDPAEQGAQRARPAVPRADELAGALAGEGVGSMGGGHGTVRIPLRPRRPPEIRPSRDARSASRGGRDGSITPWRCRNASRRTVVTAGSLRDACNRITARRDAATGITGWRRVRRGVLTDGRSVVGRASATGSRSGRLSRRAVDLRQRRQAALAVDQEVAEPVADDLQVLDPPERRAGAGQLVGLLRHAQEADRPLLRAQDREQRLGLADRSSGCPSRCAGSGAGSGSRRRS